MITWYEIAFNSTNQFCLFGKMDRLYFRSLLRFTYLLFDLLHIIPNLSEFSQSKRPSHDQKLQR